MSQIRARRQHDSHSAVGWGGNVHRVAAFPSHRLANSLPVLGVSARFGAWGVLIGAGLMCLVGALDDIWQLDWYTKLAGEVLAAGVMAWQGVQLMSIPFMD